MASIAKIGTAGILTLGSGMALPAGELPYIENLLPQSPKEVTVSLHEYHTQLKHHLTDYVDYLKLDQNPTAALRAWEKASSLTQVKRTHYWLLTDLYEEKSPELTQAANQASDQVAVIFEQDVIESPLVLEATLEFLANRPRLTPNEVHFFSRFLENFQELQPSPQIEAALQGLSELPQAPFTCLENPEAPAPEGLTILNANILFMPDNYTYFFGGVSNWEKRLEGVVELINAQSPSIVCLQEVHDETSATSLYEALKDRYRYFYLNIGSRVDILDPTHLKMNSGLFVASQYPLQNPQFTPFQVEGMQAGINKGFFEAVIEVNGQKIRLITTHLNPGENENAYRVREQELQAILSSPSPFPTFLVGDLNINWGSKDEYDKSSLRVAFVDPYNADRKVVTTESATCTEYFNTLVRTPLDKRSEVHPDQGQIVDYAVWMHQAPQKVETKTERITFYHLSEPTQARSDHNGLFSRFYFN